MEADVEARDPFDERPMIEPDDPDRDERGKVGDVGRPRLPEDLRETAGRHGIHGWHLEVQDEEGDRDRHDAVAERLDASGRREARLGLGGLAWRTAGCRGSIARRPLDHD